MPAGLLTRALAGFGIGTLASSSWRFRRVMGS